MKRTCSLLTSTLLLGLLSAFLLAGCGADQGTATTVESGTTTINTADSTAGKNSGKYPEELLYPKMVGNSSGGPVFDLEKWKATPSAAKLIAFMRNSFVYKDEMHPELLAYWDALGMKKELHDAEDVNLKWASYTPLAALEAGNTALYPVVFCFHGAYGTILGAEGYGIAELGAKEGYITVTAPTHPKGKPQRVTEGMTVGARITSILDALEEGGYPIDRGRVYVTGQSMGGATCAWATLEIPEVVTAIAMHGSVYALNTDEADVDPQSKFTLFTPASDFAKAMENDLSVPMFLEAGDSDGGRLPIRTAGVINGLNLWLQMTKCPTQLTLEDSLAAQASTTDPAVKLVGVVGDETWTRDIDGVMYHGVDFLRADGVKMIEIVGVENCPHWVTAAYPELAWEFMSRFSRDAQGNLVVAK
jgi:pimeloyl-ACP methyl ester carboxylesterase